VVLVKQEYLITILLSQCELHRDFD